MEAIKYLSQSSWMKFAIPLGVLVITLVAGWIAKRFLFRALRGWASKTKTHADDILIAGFYVSLSGHIRPGDYIKLDSGEEGIEIPFPIRTVHLRGHSTDGALKTVAAERQAVEHNR
jgi:hypothetical protein